MWQATKLQGSKSTQNSFDPCHFEANFPHENIITLCKAVYIKQIDFKLFSKFSLLLIVSFFVLLSRRRVLGWENFSKSFSDKQFFNQHYELLNERQYSAHRLIGSLWANIKVITWITLSGCFYVLFMHDGTSVSDYNWRLILFSVIQLSGGQMVECRITSKIKKYIYVEFEVNRFHIEI